ncbi:Metallo-dependent phosphatase-like protein [Gilbertella persicaria]|uniref:Metallo-dependent phosphatase-like protein n=1 Tax=Gilbertella persicaria TaxID=101096 RepID=UPI002220AD86|nr:Metallo-dependent phosphatase-like protein [Gilbertella persicaria]KAI8078095.1 Metallo-dependent phosphatase-like protein [Gilbertella persicaria]
MSLTDDAHTVRVQFATLAQVHHSLLKYWPVSKNTKAVTVQGKDWTFVDGGLAHRELYLHKIMTHKLKPATVYRYQVGSVVDHQEHWSEVFEFHTASKKDEFSFLATGDVGACNAVAVQHLKDFAKTHQYDFVTLAGDQAYDMADFNGTKGDEYLNFMQNLFARIPYLGSVGNHEGAYNFSHYKHRFDSVPYTESKFDNSLMYSINYKSLHLVSFSTEIYFTGTPDEIKTAIHWLDADLTKANQHRHQRPWIIFLTHHPIYCSVNSTDCTTKANKIRNGVVDPVSNQTWGGLEDLLLKHQVDLYYSGHVHNYERTWPVAKGKRTATSYHDAPSFFQIVIGNAGQPEGPVAFGSGPFPEWSAQRYGSFGFSTFRVTPNTLQIVHHQANVDGSLGGAIDQVTVTKSKHQRRCTF